MTQDSYYAGKGEDVPVNLSAPSNQYAVPQQQQQQQGAYYAPPYATQQASPYSMPAAQPTYMVSVQHVDSYGSSSHDGSLVPCCASSSRTFDLARAVFVRNVLLIVTAQLLLVAGMSSFFYFIDDVREFIVEQSYWTWIVAFVLELTSLILLLVFRKKKGPAAILLTIFTLASGFFVATLVCFYELRIVIEAVLITFGVVFVCVGYVVITRADFRWLILVILALSMCLLFWSFSFMFYWIYPSIYVYEWYYNVVCLIVIILFVCYLLFDMSLIVNKYPTDEYIFAAVNLYLDILTIFMYVLALLGGRK